MPESPQNAIDRICQAVLEAIPSAKCVDQIIFSPDHQVIYFNTDYGFLEMYIQSNYVDIIYTSTYKVVSSAQTEVVCTLEQLESDPAAILGPLEDYQEEAAFLISSLHYMLENQYPNFRRVALATWLEPYSTTDGFAYVIILIGDETIKYDLTPRDIWNHPDDEAINIANSIALNKS